MPDPRLHGLPWSPSDRQPHARARTARNSPVRFSNVDKRMIFQLANMSAFSCHHVPATIVNVAEYAWNRSGGTLNRLLRRIHVALEPVWKHSILLAFWTE